MTSTTTSLRFAVLITTTSGFLDAYTMLVRGGVFANAQTGNVILLALSLTRGDWHQALGYVWPIVSFAAGIAVAAHIKNGRLDHLLNYPLRWTIALQALVLLVVGFVPETVPPSLVTIPITFTAALQLELFRSIGDRSYVAIATTGNLMRWVESLYARLVTRTGARAGVSIYTSIVLAFVGGAVVGAITTRLLGVHASWIPAAVLAATLAIFVIDQRHDQPLPSDQGQRRPQRAQSSR